MAKNRGNKMRPIRLLVIILVGFAGLTACQTTAPTPPVTTADKFVPLGINARRLEIIDNWQMRVEAPYIGHRAQKLPSNMLADWAAQVLQPAGGSGELIFDMLRASVIRIELPMKTGITNLLTDQQESKIKAEFDVNIMWLQPVGGTQARVELRADHSVTIPESATANDLQTAIQTALMGALTTLDQQARVEIAKINKIILP
jgi:hypothetical protein